MSYEPEPRRSLERDDDRLVDEPADAQPFEQRPDLEVFERPADEAAPQEPASHEEPGFQAFWDKPAPVVDRGAGGKRFLTFLLAVLLGTAGGFGASWYAFGDRTASRVPGRVNVVAPPVGTSTTEPLTQTARVARAVLPSVVRIDVGGVIGNAGVGSGVIYRDDGYIVTNAHVVRDGGSVTVSLSSGERLDAAVIGTAAPTIDIAVLKVAKTRLPAATFGSTRDIEVGDLAVAIGSPFGLSSTVTAGVVSALHRNELANQAAPDLIQTDAPINPGNSGGALADARGTVIGINTAIIGQAGGNVGVGFAIPIDLVRKVADQIIDTGRVRLPVLGIQGTSVPDEGGALIQAVPANGPAAKAGIRSGDIIVGIDGAKVTSMESLIAIIIEKDVGDIVRVELMRDGRKVTVTATLAERTAR